MAASLIIAAKDIRQRFRDRSALVIGFVAPLAIATLMSVAFQASEGFQFSLGIVDDDGEAVGAALVDLLGASGLEDVVTLDTETAARGAVEDGQVAAAVVIPTGFSDAATSQRPGTTASLRVLTNVDERLAAQVTEAIVDGYLAQ